MRGMQTEETVATQAVDVASALVIMAAAVVVALLLHWLVARVLFRLKRADRFAQEVSERCRWPAMATTTMLALLASAPFTDLPEALLPGLLRGLQIATIVAAAWWAIRLTIAVEVTILSTLDLTDVDAAPHVRRRQTQAVLIRRLAVAGIVMIALGAVLLTFDTARSLGTSLLASAGVLGLVAGIAAQAALGNVVAGVQIAIAEPIKLDDVVVVEGEWGNIEEISLTYVVVRTWDRRRLVLPTSYFVSTPFTNWTRDSTQIIGAVVWHLDHRTPVGPMRTEFHRQVDASPLWDGDIASLQVIDTTETTIQVRGVVTASDSTGVWNLRCELREGLLAWLRDHHPEALPSYRIMEAAPQPMMPRPTVDTEPRPGPGPDTEPHPDPERTQQLPVHRPHRPERPW